MLALDDDDLCSAILGANLDYQSRGRYALYDVFRRNVHRLAALEASSHGLRFAYSVKTNPDPTLLEMVRDAGLYAEVISPQEFHLALALGFENRTIYNGPQPAWRAGATPGIVFSDSLRSFSENARHLKGALVGVRIRPPGVASRFGISEEERSELYDAIRASGARSIGVSMHVRPEDFRGRSWRALVATAIESARLIERHAGVHVTAFDVGGGKTPLEFDLAVSGGDFAWLLHETAHALPFANAIFAEPGQAVVTPGAIFVAPVLEIRQGSDQTDVVIAAGYPDLPQITTFSHRVLAVIEGNVQLLRPGRDRILGCTCLEYDIIRADVKLPEKIDAMEAIIVADAGAYDASMGFDFARGGNRPVDEWTGLNGGGELSAPDLRI